MSISAPTDIANCSLWLQAEQGAYVDAGSTLATNGQTVQQWNDLSGNTRHASQATSGSRPTYVTGVLNSKPALRFSGKNLQTTSFLGAGWNTACTVFLVCSRTSQTLTVALASNGVSGLYMGSSVSPLAYAGSLSKLQNRSVNGRNTPLAAHVQTFRYSGSQKTYRVNGVGAVESCTGNLSLTGTLSIGAISSGGTFAWAGDIFEIIVYQAALTDQEVSDVESWLYARYGLADQAQTQVIFDGDSITAGSGTTTNYPARVMTAVTTPSWMNLGVPGQSASDMNSDRNDQVETAFRTATTGNIGVVFGGTNDLYAGVSAATTLTRLQTYHAGLRVKGFKTVAVTILPRSDVGVAVGFEAARQTLNTSIRANTGTWYDSLADVAADIRIGDSGDELDTTYYAVDKVHPNDTGAQILADIVAPIVLGLLDSTSPSPTSAAINSAGNALVIAYTEAGSPPMLPATGVTGYTVTSSTGVAVTVSSGTISTTTVTLSLSRTIYDNETITYSYSQGSGNVTDTAGNEIAAQTNAAVTNGSTVTPITSGSIAANVLLIGVFG